MPATRPLPEFVTVTRGAKTACVHPDYQEAVAGALLSGEGCEAAPHVGRGAMQRFPYDGGTGLVRPYRRGGFIRHFVRETYLMQNRAAGELEIHRFAYARGLRVPLPLGACWERRGPFYRGAIAVAEIDAMDLLEKLRKEPESAPQFLEQCGLAIREMHDAGILHPDLQIKNLLVGGENAYIIDFDKARRYKTLDQAQRRSNLSRLRRSFLKHSVSLEHFEAIEAGYGSDS